MAYIGGIFAPPIDDAKLAEFKTLADSATAEVKEAMLALLACVLRWWDLPSSGVVGERHPVGSIAGPNGDQHPAPSLMALTADVKAALDEHIPWGRELASMNELFLGIDPDKAHRNGEKVSAWRLAVEQAVFQAMFPGVDREQWLAKIDVAHNCFVRINGSEHIDSDTATAARDAIAAALFPGETASGIGAKFAAYSAATTKAVGSPSPPVPYPVLEPVALRDAARHLWWFVQELNNDREPLTLRWDEDHQPHFMTELAIA